MKLYDGDRGFYCFSCNAKGDVIDLVQQIIGCDKWKAVEYLNQAYNLNLPVNPVDRKTPLELREHTKRIVQRREDAKARLEQLRKEQLDTFKKLCELEAMEEMVRPEMPPGGPKDVVFTSAFRNIVFARENAAYEAEEADAELHYALYYAEEQKGGEQDRSRNQSG